MTKYLTKIIEIIDIKSDADKKSTIDQINKDIYLKGPNIFYLFCSALLASVGLDVGSPAVIIGAMLISPLMSPILGIGLSLGVHDKENFFISVREFSFSVILSIVVSTIYFALTPLGEPTTEILSRIKPTVLDIIIAFFGGIAGIVAITRTKIATALPGVAIATALMPPICTAGYGLASLNFDYFFGSFYLFFINTVFISFASYLIVRYLKFPFKEYQDRKRLLRTKFIIGAFVLLVAIPSFFIFYNVIENARLNKNLNRFIKEALQSNNINVVEWKFSPFKKDSNYLSIYVVGTNMTDNKKDSLNNLLAVYGIEKTKIDIIQLSDEKGIDYIKKELKSEIFSKVRLIQKTEAEREIESYLQMSKTDSVQVSAISSDIKLFYPEIDNVGFSKHFYYSLTQNDSSTINNIPTFTIRWKNNISNFYIKSKQTVLYSYLKSKSYSDTIQIINFK